MEYERIHGVQTGVISPSKLRMKLLGVHSHWRNDGGAPSSRSSPTKLGELEHSKGSLLADQDDDGLPHPVNQSSVLPGRSPPQDGGAAGFEFHGGERPLLGLAAGPFHRPIPSKWNDAEKWIVGRQPAPPNLIKKTLMQHRYGDQPPPGNPVPETPESSCPAGGVKSVSMRDTGTEMTPMASQEPSRTGTPNGASTPSRSPVCSQPPSPRGAAPAAPPLSVGSEKAADNAELSETERRMKTRSEILALGLQLGKMNIAAWASKGEEVGRGVSFPVNFKGVDLEARAAVWEEAEKSKHNARFKRDEVKIQVWESHEKAKVEAQMREVEARAEKIKAQAHETMMRKLAVIKQRSGEKLAAAVVRRERHVAAASSQADHVRRTGHPPPPPGCRRLCCLWFS